MTKVILLAAGLGTRLRPLTNQVTKCLVPIAGRPLLDYWIEKIIEVGITEALLNTHHLAGQVRDYIEQLDGELQLIEFYEPKLLGSAGTIAANPNFADDADEIIIIYADNFSDVNLAELLNFHRQHPDPITMLLFHAPNPKACGIAELDAQNIITSFVEKPKQPKTDFANAGIYVIDSNTYKEIAAMQVFDLGFDVLPKFVGKMRGWVWDGYHTDVGTYKTYLQSQRDAVELTIDKFNRGRPAIFLDRDGTLIKSVHYLSDPEQVELVAGGGEAIKQLRKAGFACILVTNQSPIGQGIITEADLTEIHKALSAQLAEHGTQLDGFYHCPAVPQVKDRTVVDSYDRKPGPGMLFKAAQEMQIDLTNSWLIGDMISDILAGYHAKCKGLILIETDKDLEDKTSLPVSWHIVPDLTTAVKLIID